MRIILALLIGFFAHKALQYAHDYTFWASVQAECLPKTITTAERIIQCTEDKRPILILLKHLIKRPTAANELFKQSDWTY